MNFPTYSTDALPDDCKANSIARKMNVISNEHHKLSPNAQLNMRLLFEQIAEHFDIVEHEEEPLPGERYAGQNDDL